MSIFLQIRLFFGIWSWKLRKQFQLQMTKNRKKRSQCGIDFPFIPRWEMQEQFTPLCDRKLTKFEVKPIEDRQRYKITTINTIITTPPSFNISYLNP